MKSHVTFLLSLALLGGAFPAAAAPNVLLILSDDHGWADLRANGSDADIRTPELDRLAADGVRFARGYVTAPQCVPSRAGVITGRYQQRFGVEDNNKGPLPLAELTVAERLKQAGYVTGMAGKWHLDLAGGSEAKGLRVRKEFMPHAQGFDEYWRGEKDHYYASHDLQGRPLPDAPALVRDPRFRVVVQTEAALSFLDRRAAHPEQPWFLYLTWYAPHVPLESPEPWFAKTPSNLPKERRQALAMIAAMDDGLGRLRAKLRAMNAETNTLIFFIGDNGAPLGNAWNGSLNTPLVGQKGMLCEGGIRTPFVAAWPGRLPAGRLYEEPVISLDVAATAAALAGLPGDEKLDGVNLVPFLTGEKSGAPHEALFWRWSSQAAVLAFPYKLIRLGDRERLLFDVTKPDGENAAKNLVEKEPEIAARLEAKLKNWAGTLQPPGFATRFDAHHEGLFAEHKVIAAAGEAKDADPLHGWICRNGTLAVEDGALAVKPDAAGRPFLVRTRLELAGPVQVKLRVRATEGGTGSIAWRTEGMTDFTSGAEQAFVLEKSDVWQEVTVRLGAEGRVIHLRLFPPAGPARFSRIELVPAKGGPVVADFGS